MNMQIGGVESAESGSLLGGGGGSTCESQSGVFESSVDQSGREQGGCPTVEPLHLELRKLMLSGRESDGVSPKVKG